MRLKGYKTFVRNHQVRATLMSLFASLVTLSCTGGGGISAGGGTSVAGGTVTISLVYPTAAGPSWTPIIASNRTYILGLDVTVSGVCTRGVDTVQFSEGGTLFAEIATCPEDGNFTWSKSFTGPLDADKTLTATAYDVTGAIITGSDKTFNVHIDNVAPLTPVISTPSAGAATYTYTGSNATLDITGTCAVDVDHINGPNALVPIACSAGAWTYTVTLIPGGQVSNTFRAVDLAGNISSGITKIIQFTPAMDLIGPGVISGGHFTDSSGGGSPLTLESAVDIYPAATISNTATSPNPSFDLLTGFNSITNEVRSH